MKINLLILFLFFLTNVLFPHGSNKSAKLISTQIDKRPVIDGLLDDEIWNRNSNIDEYFTTYSPVNGDIIPERTRVWISNDKENIYFAFYCYDSQPDRIKSSITSHDDIWNDDWIGFNLDPIGNKSYGYVLVTNPLGIQADIFDSPVTGSDGAPDYVWYSAGKILDDGYSIEIQIPLKNFTYSSGINVEMNIIFERKISRLGLSASYPSVPVGQTFFAGMCKIVIPEIENQLKLQVIPSVTYNNSWTRENPDSWSKGAGAADFGLTAKYGITSTVAVEGTYNPDFSHVESDAFQVLINQRYPIYYVEKRPFFMETRNIFNISGGNLGGKSLLSAVHTRKIVDPLWGAKISGEHNGWLFGFMASGDEWPGRKFDNEIEGANPNPFEGKSATYIIGRAKYILEGENNIGAIVTNKSFGEGYNRVIGLDANLRLGEGNHWIRANVLSSYSKNENTLDNSKGIAGNFAYNYVAHFIEYRTDYEYIDTDFQMATAFLNRKAISKWSNMLRLNFYPENENFSFIKKITPQLYVNVVRDLTTKEFDSIYKAGTNFNFILQGSLRTEYQWFSEFWYGQRLDGGYFNTFGQIQLTNWLRIYTQFNHGDKIYYSAADPFVGKGTSAKIQLTLQPNNNLNQFFQYQYQDLFRKETDEKVYDVNIFISNTTYQLNRHLFLRAIVQYDSYRNSILIDALASYELVPGTVLQIGYGSLYKNLYWQDDNWSPDDPRRQFYQTDESVFIKISYLFQ